MYTLRYLLVGLTFALTAMGAAGENASRARIDRRSVVDRHAVVYHEPHPEAPLTIGNGRFGFTADITGLQSFPEAYTAGVPLSTMAEWAWHSRPNPNGHRLEDTFKDFDSHGRAVAYAYDPIVDPMSRRGPSYRTFGSEAARWLYENPHRVGLGQVGLVLTGADGHRAELKDLRALRQRLDLWTGVLASEFEFEGQRVAVETLAHPDDDLIAIRVTSPLLASGQLRLRVRFAGARGEWFGSPDDWEAPQSHVTTPVSRSANRVDFRRQIGETSYHAAFVFPKGGGWSEFARHEFLVDPPKGAASAEFALAFGREEPPAELPAFSASRSACATGWAGYWNDGGMIDLSGSQDPRWRELERRVVLSQYLTAINCAGALPPQESGHVLNTWYGKFHLEMHWWHDAHFALWGRLPLMQRSMAVYRQLLPVARAAAKRQGYAGARWPKMIGPEGRESPNSVNPFLLWQQPHPIYFAELCRRENPTRETLEQWWEIVEATADFMSGFAVRNPATGHYDLGPPLNDVQERSTIDAARNPPFEVAYWKYGLAVARQWRERIGRAPNPHWDDVARNLPPIVPKDGVYDIQFSQFGLLPLPGDLDPAVCGATVERIVRGRRPEMCSWNYSVIAMAAARAGRPDLAIETLFDGSASNSFTRAGYSYWCDIVPVYLPGNGALLSAVAMMAAGWDGAPERPAPGFPEGPQWVVKAEGLRRIP